MSLNLFFKSLGVLQALLLAITNYIQLPLAISIYQLTKITERQCALLPFKNVTWGICLFNSEYMPLNGYH